MDYLREDEGYINPQAEQGFLTSGRASAFMRMVYTTMTLGLALTGFTAWMVSQDPQVMEFISHRRHALDRDAGTAGLCSGAFIRH